MRRRSPLRRTPLERGSRPLSRREPLKRGEGLKRSGTSPLRGTSVRKRAISRASRPQKLKVRSEGKCRVCQLPADVAELHPAHVADRSLGGCDEPLCVCALCPVCHRRYDEGELDLLPFLTREEQAHAVAHLGLVGALRRITNDREAAG